MIAMFQSFFLERASGTEFAQEAQEQLTLPPHWVPWQKLQFRPD
jgi:hypothetical protein